MADQKQKSSALTALQDVRKMRRSIRLRESTNPVVVGELLTQILREILVARQSLGSGRLGKNAVRELGRVRNDLVTGSIDAGPRQAEFITKFTTVHSELKDIDQEEKQMNKSQAAEEAKESVRSLIPRKEMVMSGIMAASPVLGYGLKIGGALGKGLTGLGRSRQTTISDKRLDDLRKSALEEQEAAVTDSIKSTDDNNQISILAEKLDLIREELKQFRQPVERIEETTYHNQESLDSIERTNEDSFKEQEETNWRLTRERKEARFEAFDNKLVGSSDTAKDGSSKSAGLLGSMFDVSGMGEGNAGSAAFGGALGTIGARGALLLGAKVLLGTALVAAVGYALWKYRDEVSEYIIDPLKNFFKELFEGGDTGGALGIEGGTEGIKRNIEGTVNKQQSILDLADRDSKVLEAKSARDEAETMKDNLETSLGILESEWDRLVEQSNRELDETGLISDKTREAMLKNNEAQQQVKEQLDDAKDELKRLVKELRNITVERRGFYRDNYTPEERTQMLNGESVGAPSNLLDFIGEKESGGNYNALVYGREGFDTPTQTDLTSKTIGEVQGYQAGMYRRGHASSAVGKYQFIQDTLKDAVANTPGVDMDTEFTPEVQDKLATTLLNRRGLQDYKSGNLPLEDFAENLSHEWASLPLSSGMSAYEGLAGNTASGSYSDYLGVLSDAKNDTSPLELDTDAVSDSSQINPTGVVEDQLAVLDQLEGTRSTQGQDSPTIINNNTQQAPAQSQQRPSPPSEPENHDKSWRDYMFNQNSFGAAF